MTEDELWNISHLLAMHLYGYTPTVVVNGYCSFVYVDVDFERVYVRIVGLKEDNVSQKVAHIPRYPQR